MKALGLVNTIWAPNTFFEILEPEKAQGGRGLELISENCFFNQMARFAQGMQNVILHIYFIFGLHLINFGLNII